MVCKPTKASLFVREVEFAEHVAGHEHRRPMPGKLAALRHCQEPQTISELRYFMDMYECMAWTAEGDEAFHKLK